MNTRFATKMVGIVIAIMLLAPYIPAHAQFTSDTTQESVEVDISNENPQPGERISFKATSYLSDLDKATITWNVNGKKAVSGVGMREFTTTMPGVGSALVIDLTIQTDHGTIIKRNFSFKSASVDLIWQADSYVPPFYKGKALLTEYEYAKVVAIPHLGATMTTLSPSNLIYTWTQDGKPLASASGYGKNVLYIDRAQTGKAITIGVTVTTNASSISANNTITLRPSKAKVVTYPYSQAYGTLSSVAVDTGYSMTTKEASFIAIPYFFPAISTDGSTYLPLDFNWIMNNEDTGTQADIFTVRNENNQTGNSTISVTVERKEGSIKQSATKTFTIGF